jgi:hypothetical protein
MPHVVPALPPLPDGDPLALFREHCAASDYERAGSCLARLILAAAEPYSDRRRQSAAALRELGGLLANREDAALLDWLAREWPRTMSLVAPGGRPALVEGLCGELAPFAEALGRITVGESRAPRRARNDSVARAPALLAPEVPVSPRHFWTRRA